MTYFPTIIRDSREQQPWLFPECYPVEERAMKVADYSIKGFERRFAAERKSKEDFISSIRPYNERDPEDRKLIRDDEGKAIKNMRQGWGRFERELAALDCFQRPFLIIEAPYEDFERGEYNGMMAPAAVCARIFSLIARGNLKVLFAKDETQAAQFFLMLVDQFVKGVENDGRLVEMDRRKRKPENQEFAGEEER